MFLIKTLKGRFNLTDSPFFRPFAAAFVAFAIWVGFSVLLTSENIRHPGGDASFYSSMAYSFFTSHRDKIEVSSIHGKRILAPFIVAVILKAVGADTTLAIQYPYNYLEWPRDKWPNEAAVTYDLIHKYWQIINGVAFILLGMAIILLIPSAWPSTIGWLLWINLMTIPSLGLLYVYIPQMNDVLTLAIFSWSLVAFQRNRETSALLLLGIAALGREQVLMTLPLIYLFRRFSILTALGLALGPYALINLFPPFSNFIPLNDGSSEVEVGTTSPIWTYIKLFEYHWKSLWSQKGLTHPFGILLNLGPVLIMAYFLERAKDRRLWVLFGLCFVFMADRHMVLLGLVGIFGLAATSTTLIETRERTLLRVLSYLAFFKVLLLLVSQNGNWLQAEHWFRLLPPREFRIFMQVLWGLILLSSAANYFSKSLTKAAHPEAN